MDAPRVYVGAWALCCFQSYQYSNHLERSGSVGGQLRGNKVFLQFWRKVPESDARSVGELGDSIFREHQESLDLLGFRSICLYEIIGGYYITSVFCFCFALWHEPVVR